MLETKTKIEEFEESLFEIVHDDGSSSDTVDQIEGTAEDAREIFRDCIKDLVNPSELTLYRVEGDMLNPMWDLMYEVFSEVDVEDLSTININTPINMNTAEKIGFTLIKETTWHDHYTSLDKMAQIEADARKDAKDRQLTTGVDVEHEMHVSWNEDCDQRIKKMYDEKLQHYLNS
jgi:hypothetical protein